MPKIRLVVVLAEMLTWAGMEEDESNGAQAGARSRAAAFVRLDRASLRAGDAVDAPLDLDEEPWDRVARAWTRLAIGHTTATDRLEQLENQARREGRAELVLEASALRALGAEAGGDLEVALEQARRSWRMARTERVPESEYLAGLVLARLRRLTGRPYLATRILQALHRLVPRPWHPWVEWEQMVAHGRGDELPATPLASRLHALLGHAEQGTRDRFVEAFAELSGDALLAPIARDLGRIRGVLDASADLDDLDPAVRSWCLGARPFEPPPFGLAGLDAGSKPDQHGFPSLVVARPKLAGRRILRLGMGLVEELDAGLTDQVGRSEALIAALALAGPPGLTDAELFAAAYGFSFDPALHRGALDVALHRVRRRVEGRAVLERADGRVWLRVEAPFVVPDPRSMPPTEDRVLGQLATRHELGARELAKLLDTPLRTVQKSLQDLVDAGACQQHRVGRRIVYTVEDTTFQEPTGVGLR